MVGSSQTVDREGADSRSGTTLRRNALLRALAEQGNEGAPTLLLERRVKLFTLKSEETVGKSLDPVNLVADHLDRLTYGAAAGVLLGATYGVVKSTQSLAEMDNGKVKFALPTIIPDIQDTNAKGQTPIIVMAELFRGKF